MTAPATTPAPVETTRPPTLTAVHGVNLRHPVDRTGVRFVVHLADGRLLTLGAAGRGDGPVVACREETGAARAALAASLACVRPQRLAWRDLPVAARTAVNDRVRGVEVGDGLDALARAVAAAVALPTVVVMRFVPDVAATWATREIEVAAVASTRTPGAIALPVGAGVPAHQTLCGRVFDSRVPRAVGDLSRMPRLAATVPPAVDMGLRAYAGALVTTRGRAVATVCAVSALPATHAQLHATQAVVRAAAEAARREFARRERATGRREVGVPLALTPGDTGVRRKTLAHPGVPAFV